MEDKYSTDNNWICPHCGPVKPKIFYYSFPMQANCPKCLFKMESSQGVKILLPEDLKKKRLDLNKDEK